MFEMDAFSHAVIAVVCLFIAWYVGRNWGRKSLSEAVIETTLDNLERSGYICTETGRNGEKELIPISEILANKE